MSEQMTTREIAESIADVLLQEGEYQNSAINENTPQFLQIARDTGDKEAVVDYIADVLAINEAETIAIYRYLENTEMEAFSRIHELKEQPSADMSKAEIQEKLDAECDYMNKLDSLVAEVERCGMEISSEKDANRYGDVWISRCKDVGENEGGYYCQVYADKDMSEQIDDFCIHTFECDCTNEKEVEAFIKDYAKVYQQNEQTVSKKNKSVEMEH